MNERRKYNGGTKYVGPKAVFPVARYEPAITRRKVIARASASGRANELRRKFAIGRRERASQRRSKIISPNDARRSTYLGSNPNDHPPFLGIILGKPSSQRRLRHTRPRRFREAEGYTSVGRPACRLTGSSLLPTSQGFAQKSFVLTRSATQAPLKSQSQDRKYTYEVQQERSNNDIQVDLAILAQWCPLKEDTGRRRVPGANVESWGALEIPNKAKE
ncbi:uncharacterized protein LOC107264588 [Cephus cinctus]|uniref:Uncharacterized protein LOC107264588 n=1 Tax=Cephus cinctus TaxID=211228 RepID=A0AAJ7RC61_CEPCN|nr:uncharacterized protein LOC107264588 [Cephus cinctus]